MVNNNEWRNLLPLSFVLCCWNFYFVFFFMFSEGTESSCKCVTGTAKLADIMDCNVIIGGKEGEGVSLN